MRRAKGMKTFDFIQMTISHNLKDPHPKVLEPDCLSPFLVIVTQSQRAVLPGKVISFCIVPLPPALPAKAGRGTCRSIGLEEFLGNRRGDGSRPISLTHDLSDDGSPLIDENRHGDHSDFISIDDILFQDQEHG